MEFCNDLFLQCAENHYNLALVIIFITSLNNLRAKITHVPNISKKETCLMDKTILFAGIALLSLGAGFLTAQSFDTSLHSAFTTGGYLWLAMGGITISLGLKAKKDKEKQQMMGALR